MTVVTSENKLIFGGRREEENGGVLKAVTEICSGEVVVKQNEVVLKYNLKLMRRDGKM